MTEAKPILCLDFDGVLHEYRSGWKGARCIPDPPVPGAIPALLSYLKHFDVCILSSRSHQWGGRRAMKRWLRKWLALYFKFDTTEACKWADNPHQDDDWYLAESCADDVLSMIRFPRHKPPATVVLDDRAINFDGNWPEVGQLESFTPWNRTPGNNPPHEKPELYTPAPLDVVSGEPSGFFGKD